MNITLIPSYEWGFKLSHEGRFIKLGDIALEMEDAHDLTDPDLLDGVLRETAAMIKDSVGTLIIPTIRPIPMDENIED